MSYTVTVDNHNFTVGLTSTNYNVTFSQVGQQGTAGVTDERFSSLVIKSARLSTIFSSLPVAPTTIFDFSRDLFLSGEAILDFEDSLVFGRASAALSRSVSGMALVASGVPEYPVNPVNKKRQGIRVHGSLTNLVQQPSNLTSWWSFGSGCSATFTASGGPIEGEGYSTINGYGAATSGARVFSPSITATAGEDYATGVWLRGTGTDVGKNVVLYVARASGGTTTFEVVTVTLTSDWVFHDLGITLAGDNTNITVRLIGTTVNPADNVDVAGWQLYANRLAVDAQCIASRAGDTVALPDMSEFVGPELSLSFSGVTAKDTATGKNQYLFDAVGATGHRITIYRSTSSGNLVALVNAGGTQQTITIGNLGVDTPFRMSMSIKNDEIVTTLNGSATATDTGLVGFPVLTSATIGYRTPLGTYDAWDGIISDVLVWQEVLAPSVLRGLFSELG